MDIPWGADTIPPLLGVNAAATAVTGYGAVGIPDSPLLQGSPATPRMDQQGLVHTDPPLIAGSPANSTSVILLTGRGDPLLMGGSPATSVTKAPALKTPDAFADISGYRVLAVLPG
jgi:hypothetical protein